MLKKTKAFEITGFACTSARRSTLCAGRRAGRHALGLFFFVKTYRRTEGLDSVKVLLESFLNTKIFKVFSFCVCECV